MAQRLNLKEKPYQVVSTSHLRGGNYRDHREEFSDEGKARSRADQLAKEKNVVGVYIHVRDEDGFVKQVITVKRSVEDAEPAPETE